MSFRERHYEVSSTGTCTYISTDTAALKDTPISSNTSQTRPKRQTNKNLRGISLLLFHGVEHMEAKGIFCVVGCIQ